jgi:hypothetical protein
MEYSAIASLKASSARKSSSTDTMIFALPSMAVANTGKSLGSRQCGGIVFGSIQIARFFNCCSSRMA